MAPLTNEPDAIRVVLNLARRKAYYNLVVDITNYMKTQLELQDPTQDLNTTSTRAAAAAGQSSGTVGDDSEQQPPPPPYYRPNTNADGNYGTEGVNAGENESQTARATVRARQPPTPELIRLRKAVLLHFGSWRTETLGKLKELAAKADDQKIVDARRLRAEKIAEQEKSREGRPAAGEDLLCFETGSSSSTTTPVPDPSATTRSSISANPNVKSKELEAFQNLYHPIPTRLTTIPLRDREEVLSATLLLLLSVGDYSAYSRTLLCYVASALEIPPSTLDKEETEVATMMVETAQKASDAEAAGGGMSAEAEAQKRRDEGKVGRYWKVGLASVAGAAIVGVTGGLAAPVVAGVVGGLMGSVGLGGLASFLGIFWMNGALVGTLFGAFGAKMTGEMADRYAKEVEDFKFLPLRAEFGEQWVKPEVSPAAAARRLRVTIGINGWLVDEEDVTRPWRVLGPESEVFALRFEMSSLLSLGQKLRSMVGSAAWSAIRGEILKRTVLATLQTALWPILLLNSASSVDNPFSLARNRSEKAGQILADALINRVQGERPVTLVGFSLGARVIYSCLRTLAERRAFGLVDTVVLIGAPVPSNVGHWEMMRSVVAGKLFNVHSENDYILGFLYRSTSLQLGIAGLQAVGADIEGVEDLDLSAEVAGHLRYPQLIGQILHRCGFPNVEGGNKAIEKESLLMPGGAGADIQLRDKDYAEQGRLIDFGGDGDEGPRPLLPSRHTLRERENEKFDPSVKNVGEQKSDANTRQMRLLDGGKAGLGSGNQKSDLNRSGGSSCTRSVSITEQGRDVYGGIRATSGTDRDQGQGHDDHDEPEDENGGNSMMNYADDLEDGELTMVEPLSIEDEEDGHIEGSTH
ncbi:DUF726-domain-containing protein [Xylariaceae sp. FL0255]|nr:DUF726-domain-containing protein [Xylariaceae sp. FL0255]